MLRRLTRITCYSTITLFSLSLRSPRDYIDFCSRKVSGYLTYDSSSVRFIESFALCDTDFKSTRNNGFSHNCGTCRCLAETLTRFKVMTDGQLVQKVAPTARRDANDAVRFSLRKKRRESVSLLTDVSHALHPLPSTQFSFLFFYRSNEINNNGNTE